MRKLFLFLFLASLSFVADAQTIKFAAFSSDSVMKVMPDYIAAQATLKELRGQYNAEVKRTEEDFNNKYEAFIEVYSSLDTNIRNKRQTELQELMVKGMAFKDEAGRLLRKAEADAMAPVRARIDDALAEVAKEYGYAFVLDKDKGAVPYVNIELCDDITELLKNKLK